MAASLIRPHGILHLQIQRLRRENPRDHRYGFYSYCCANSDSCHIGLPNAGYMRHWFSSEP